MEFNHHEPPLPMTPTQTSEMLLKHDASIERIEKRVEVVEERVSEHAQSIGSMRTFTSTVLQQFSTFNSQQNNLLHYFDSAMKRQQWLICGGIGVTLFAAVIGLIDILLK